MHALLIILISLVFSAPASAQANGPATRSNQVEYPTYSAHVNGLSIAYQEFGDPSNDTILLIMGLGAQLIHWDDDIVWKLVDGGYHVVRFDNRDIGWSTKLYNSDTPGIMTGIRYKLGMSLGSPYKLDDMAADAYGLLGYLDVSRAHVVGVSMGGMIAQIMAARYPDRVKSLTSIMSTTGAPHLARGTVDLDLERDASNRQQSIEGTVEIGQKLDGTVAELSPEEWRRIGARGYDRSNYPEGFARQFWAILDSGDRSELLKTVTQPTVVIHGKEDNLVPYESGEHTAQSIAGSKLVLLEGMGHFIDAVSKPKVIAEILAVAEKAQ